MTQGPPPPSERTRVRREGHRGRYDRSTIDAILDEGLFCHLGFVHDGQPFVVPTLHARIDDRVFVHGSSASRMLRSVAGRPVCVTVTLLDGLVLARSIFNHSINYRSVMLLGAAEQAAEDDKLRALEAFTDQIVPGRWRDARQPTPKELKATTVISIPIDEASAKVRSGPPNDDEDDLSWPAWAGVLPLEIVPGDPIPAPDLPADKPVPGYVSSYRRGESRETSDE